MQPTNLQMKSSDENSKKTDFVTTKIQDLRKNLKKLSNEDFFDKIETIEKQASVGNEKTARLAFDKVLLSFEIEKLTFILKCQEDFTTTTLRQIRELEEERREEKQLTETALFRRTELCDQLNTKYLELSKKYLEERQMAESTINSLNFQLEELQNSFKTVKRDLEEKELLFIQVKQQLTESENKFVEMVFQFESKIKGLKSNLDETMPKALKDHYEEIGRLQTIHKEEFNKIQNEKMNVIIESGKNQQKLNEQIEYLKEEVYKLKNQSKSDIMVNKMMNDVRLVDSETKILELEKELKSQSEYFSQQIVEIKNQKEHEMRKMIKSLEEELNKEILRVRSELKVEFEKEHISGKNDNNFLIISLNEKLKQAENQILDLKAKMSISREFINKEDEQERLFNLKSYIELLKDKFVQIEMDMINSEPIQEKFDQNLFSANIKKMSLIEQELTNVIKIQKDAEMKLFLLETQEKSGNNKNEFGFKSSQKEIKKSENGLTFEEKEHFQAKIEKMHKTSIEMKNIENQLRSEIENLSNYIEIEKNKCLELNSAKLLIERNFKMVSTTNNELNQEIVLLKKQIGLMDDRIKQIFNQAEEYRQKYENFHNEYGNKNSDLKETIEKAKKMEEKYYQTILKVEGKSENRPI